jgi:hypothetical protein
VPGAHEPAPGFDRKVRASLGEQIVERLGVELVEVAPRSPAVVDVADDRPVARAPCVGKLLGVAGGSTRAKRVRDPRAPVDQRPEDVEDERADGRASR